MNFPICIIFFGLAINLAPVYSTKSAFVCSGSWDVRKNDSERMFGIFQNWIYGWQNNCVGKTTSAGLPIGSGIGSGMESATRWLMWALESNRIYRPSGHWAWADPNVCPLKTVDCYFRPLSSCGLQTLGNMNLFTAEEQNQYNESTQIFGRESQDSCSLARKAKKPLQWIHGSLLHYIMRPSEHLRSEIHAAVVDVRRQAGNGSLIGVHIRRGTPDSGRHVANTSYYIAAVDSIADQLVRLGRPPVTGVYICSDLQQELEVDINIIFPRPWIFFFRPHFFFPPDIFGNKTKEIQHVVESGRIERRGFSKRTMAVEYFVDLEILAQADAFVGSSSNVYTVVTGLRVARGYDLFKNHSCFLQLMGNPVKLVCEGTSEALAEWNHHSLGGYTGGTLF